VNCPDCGAVLRLEEGKDYLTCNYCRNMHFPELNDDGVRVLGEEAEQFCPICRIPLLHASVEGMRMLSCGQCRGILLNMNVFVDAVDALRVNLGRTSPIKQTISPKDLERVVRCPRCHARMDTHLYGGPGRIIIDSCSDCRLIWLDFGELRRVVHGPDNCWSKQSLL
jgi:Zn-finger nucleic acid-binding protein